MSNLEDILRQIDVISEKEIVNALYECLTKMPFKYVRYKGRLLFLTKDCATIAYDGEFHLMMRNSERLYSWYNGAADKLTASFRLREIWKLLRDLLKEPETNLEIITEFNGDSSEN